MSGLGEEVRSVKDIDKERVRHPRKMRARMRAVAVTAPHAVFSLPSTPSASASSSSTAIHFDSVSRFRHLGLFRFRARVRHRKPILNAASSAGAVEVGFREIQEKCSKWQWKGHTISYLVVHPPQARSSNPPLLLVHGFGASIAHWRRNIMILAESQTVYAIDLLGFGASDKPAGFAYTMEIWAQLILDFLDEIVRKPTVLIGNSVGSLACVIAASESTNALVRGLVLLNCAGGMNNKAIVDDWRIKLLLPLLWLFDFLLKQRGIASSIFERVKQRDNLRNILLSIYGNKESVDEDLLQIITEPADDEGALDAFVSILTGPPGPNPVQLMPRLSLPILVLWGNQDPFTPLDGPVGKCFASLPSQQPNISLFILEGVGHCPHDDRPDLVHEKLIPWLASLPTS